MTLTDASAPVVLGGAVPPFDGDRVAQEGTLVAAIDRAARRGVALGATLAAQAAEARDARRRSIQEDAAKAGPKMQLVVALLLVPSVLLLVAAALTAALLSGGAVELAGP